MSSVLGQGTAFTVRLPFGASHLPQDRINPEQTRASTAARAEAYVEEALRWLPVATQLSQPMTFANPAPPLPSAAAKIVTRLLVADDNADMRSYLCSILGSRYTVVAVSDGAAALKAMRLQRPALAVIDVMMPLLDGFAALREIRHDAALKDLPVILLSARAGEEAEAEGLAAGADDYIVKPFSARELMTRIQASIAMARLRNEAAAARFGQAKSVSSACSKPTPWAFFSSAGTER